MNKTILHIPHSSTNIPFMDGYIVDDTILNDEILKLTDWYTDDLFDSSDDIIIKAEFSRIFCDVERFTDDAKEVMAQFGMGVLYEKSDDGRTIRNVTPQIRQRIFKEYYWEHHSKLTQAVQFHLEQYGRALIIDCHSFPCIPHKRSLNKRTPRPDFNIGTDSYHTPQSLIDAAKDFFDKKGYTLGIDWPYSGSIVPLEYYQKNHNVQTIMLEINRKLYLNEPSNSKSEKYKETKDTVSEFIKTIKRHADKTPRWAKFRA